MTVRASQAAVLALARGSDARPRASQAAVLVLAFEQTTPPVHVTQVPALVVYLPIQPVRVTQVPALMVHLPIQNVRATQIPVMPVWYPNPIPLPKPLVPDVPLIETWTWKTALQISENASEQRARLREVPRIGMSFTTAIADDAERRLAFDLLFKYQRQAFAYPLYHYSVVLKQSAVAGATSLVFPSASIEAREGELLALFDPQHEITYFVTCETLNANDAVVSPLPVDVPAGWYVCGVATFRTDPVIGLTMNAIDGEIELVMVSTISRDFENPFSAAAITTYDGICVIDDRPLANDRVPEEFNQNVEWLDNNIGTPEPITNWQVPFISGERQYLSTRPTGLHKWRAIADHLKGMQNTFLLPTFRQDFPLTETPALGATVIKTSRIQFFDYWRSPAYRYLRIVTANGVIYRRITEVLDKYDNDGNPIELWIKINTALGGSAGDNQISMVSLMPLCRLNDDTISLEHREVDTVLTLQVRGVGA